MIYSRFSKVLAVVLVVGIGWHEITLAHSSLIAANIRDGQVVRVMPKTITLEFSEALEVGFSKFKLVALDSKINSAKAANAAAETILEASLDRRDDDEIRADAELLTKAAVAAKLELKFKPKLVAGWYVMMWKIVSIDTHVSRDFFVFSYRP
jgi:copper resistance protein C